MKNILFLDDDKNRHKEFAQHFPNSTHVSTAGTCFEALCTSEWDIICLDHDLGTKADGSTLAKWISRMDYPKSNIGYIFLHSYNPRGALNMAHKLRDTNIPLEIQPFGALMFDAIKRVIKY